MSVDFPHPANAVMAIFRHLSGYRYLSGPTKSSRSRSAVVHICQLSCFNTILSLLHLRLSAAKRSGACGKASRVAKSPLVAQLHESFT